MKYEIWKPVVGLENRYEVSNYGQVRSLNYRMKKGVSCILRPAKNSDGYKNVHLYARDGGKTYKIHRLVAEAFLLNPHGFTEVNHKNEDKADNRVENLEWCERNYNMRYGTIADRNRARQNRRIIATDPNTGAVVHQLPSMAAAASIGYDPTSISRCCRKARGTEIHKGLRWSFEGGEAG
jgi:hypothetical protein